MVLASLRVTFGPVFFSRQEAFGKETSPPGDALFCFFGFSLFSERVPSGDAPDAPHRADARGLRTCEALPRISAK